MIASSTFPFCFQGVWSFLGIVDSGPANSTARWSSEHAVVDSAGTTPPDPPFARGRKNAAQLAKFER